MAAYRFEGYWKDVGTLDSLWDANMDMLLPGSGLNLLDRSWPIFGRTPSCPPAFVGTNADVGNSVVAKGCRILGEVKNTVLSYNTTVGEGASVCYSVVLPGAVIESGARVEYAIVGENCHIGKDAAVGLPPECAEDPDKWGIAVLGPGSVVAKGEVVASGEVLGIKRIRVLDEARPRKDLSFEPILPKGRRPKGWAAYAGFYYADPELIKLVQSATTESGETDTAKWMTAGQEGK